MTIEQKINSKIVRLEFSLRLLKENTAMSFEKPEEWKKRIYEMEGGISSLKSLLVNSEEKSYLDKIADSMVQLHSKPKI